MNDVWLDRLITLPLLLIGIGLFLSVLGVITNKPDLPVIRHGIAIAGTGLALILLGLIALGFHHLIYGPLGLSG